MGTVVKTIAVICDYQLIPDRVGGMDTFFWLFDQKCKVNGINVHWFFPNESRHQGYEDFTIYNSDFGNVEQYFLGYIRSNNTIYTHVITHFIELCLPVFRKVKKETRVQIIQVDHNPLPPMGYPRNELLKRKMKGILYSRYIDVFVGVSEFSQTKIVSEYGSFLKSKTRIIFNGLEIDKFKKKTDFEFKRKFIVASHLRYEKGIQDLILAVKELVKENKFDFIIDIYGSGNYQEVLQEMINVYSLEKYFTFKGNTNHLNSIYYNYDYLIHPSHGETFCYSVIEGLLSNLPVITTYKHGNVLGKVQDNVNGFLFEKADIIGLKTILCGILTNQRVIKSRMGKDDFSQFSVDVMVAEYYNLII